MTPEKHAALDRFTTGAVQEAHREHERAEAYREHERAEAYRELYAKAVYDRDTAQKRAEGLRILYDNALMDRDTERARAEMYHTLTERMADELHRLKAENKMLKTRVALWPAGLTAHRA